MSTMVSMIMVIAMLWITMVAGQDYINVALGKPAKQKDDENYTLPPNESAQRAVDGNHNPDYWSNSCSHTNLTSLPTWWMVDLLAQYKIEAVKLTNRDMAQERLQKLTVYVSSTNPEKHPDFPSNLPGKQCVYYYGPIVYGTETIPCTSPVYGLYLIIYKEDYECLTLCEVEVLTRRSSIIDAQFLLLQKNTRSLHQVLHNTSGISTALWCGSVCIKATGGPATLLQHHKWSQNCECIRFSEFNSSDYLTYSDIGVEFIFQY